ncbi:MAG: FHA domain-containing protein, partial [Planctomycetes bacterium]|nr:FHA domain-containing protein [Planctomycetota bacterium]
MGPDPTQSALQLPTLALSAPRVQLTSLRADPSQQRTLNIRQPVTLIGSREGCKVRLRHPQVSSSHCAIVITGTQVFLRDLGSRKGTYFNEQVVELEELHDGDEIRIRSFRFKVSIEFPEPAQPGASDGLADLTSMNSWMFLDNVETNETVELARPVSSVGRLAGNDLVVQGNHVSRAHALLFLLDGVAVVCDLASATGTYVNSKRMSLAYVFEGHVLRFGRNEYTVRLAPSVRTSPPDRAIETAGSADEFDLVSEAADLSGSGTGLDLDPGDSGILAADDAILDRMSDSAFTAGRLGGPADRLADSSLDREAAQRLEEREAELAATLAEVEEREAALREKNDWLESRLEELDGQVQQLDEQKAELARREQAVTDQERDLAAKHEEIARACEDAAQVSTRTQEMVQRSQRFREQSEQLEDLLAELDRQEAAVAEHEARVRQRESEILGIKKEVDERLQTIDDHERTAASMFQEAKDEYERMDTQRREVARTDEELAERVRIVEQREQEVEETCHTVE